MYAEKNVVLVQFSLEIEFVVCVEFVQWRLKSIETVKGKRVSSVDFCRVFAVKVFANCYNLDVDCLSERLPGVNAKKDTFMTYTERNVESHKKRKHVSDKSQNQIQQLEGCNCLMFLFVFNSTRVVGCVGLIRNAPPLFARPEEVIINLYCSLIARTEEINQKL